MQYSGGGRYNHSIAGCAGGSGPDCICPAIGQVRSVSTGVSTNSVRSGFFDTNMIYNKSDMNVENPRKNNKKWESLDITGFPILCGRRDLNPGRNPYAMHKISTVSGSCQLACQLHQLRERVCDQHSGLFVVHGAAVIFLHDMVRLPAAELLDLRIGQLQDRVTI